MKKAIIVDLDGTLCNIDHRKKYIDGSLGKKDWDKFYEGCGEDEVNEWCKDIIQALHVCGECSILYITGRPDMIKDETQYWLDKHTHLDNFSLYMRKTNDFRQDYIVKKELYEKHVKGKFDVLFAIDDRQQVVDMWREQGLVCLQCDKGDF